MKKILVALLALVILMAGCGAKPATPPKIGTASIVSRKAASATAEKSGTAQADILMCTVSLDKDGKITYVSFDAAQPKFEFNDKGEAVADLTKPVETKKELGANYGMAKVSAIGKEWFEQIAAYEEWLMGKTIDEAVAMKTTADKAVPDVAELKSSVTIDIGGYRDALVKAAANAK